MRFKTIYADPPWNERGGGKIKRGADRHYSLMKTADIKKLMLEKVEELAEIDCHMYLWVTNNHLKDGLEVIEHCGFRFVTMITWAKDRIGLGQYFRGQTEQCLFAIRGTLPYKTLDGKRRQGTTLVNAPRAKHSEKPEEMRKMIERVSYPPRIELFARTKQIGWVSWGDEI